MKSIALAALLLAGTALGAQAATFSFTTDNASFSGTAGGTNKSSTSSGDNASLRWGQNVGYGQSSFTWDGYDGTVEAIEGLTTNFTFGEIKHRNEPIGSGTGILSTVLNFELGLLGVVVPVQLNIRHTETPNNDSLTCCADIVSMSSVLNKVIEKDGFLATLSITPVFFSTPEKSSRSKLFVGSLTYNRIPEIPVPAALPLFVSGLAGIGWLAKSRRRRV